MGETENLYVDSFVKILAVMYGIVEGSEGSCDWAVAIIEFSDEVRNLASGSHFRPLASVAAVEPPQANTKDSDAEVVLDDLTVVVKIEKEMREIKTWVLEIMDFGKHPFEGFENGGWEIGEKVMGIVAWEENRGMENRGTRRMREITYLFVGQR